MPGNSPTVTTMEKHKATNTPPTRKSTLSPRKSTLSPRKAIPPGKHCKCIHTCQKPRFHAVFTRFHKGGNPPFKPPYCHKAQSTHRGGVVVPPQNPTQIHSKVNFFPQSLHTHLWLCAAVFPHFTTSTEPHSGQHFSMLIAVVMRGDSICALKFLRLPM